MKVICLPWKKVNSHWLAECLMLLQQDLISDFLVISSTNGSTTGSTYILYSSVPQKAANGLDQANEPPISGSKAVIT